MPEKNENLQKLEKYRLFFYQYLLLIRVWLSEEILDWNMTGERQYFNIQQQTIGVIEAIPALNRLLPQFVPC
ncbi:MAG: hypothetical protein PVG35_17510 [Desulfobacterales bacterium]|jgi:hypothetical protein